MYRPIQYGIVRAPAGYMCFGRMSSFAEVLPSVLGSLVYVYVCVCVCEHITIHDRIYSSSGWDDRHRTEANAIRMSLSGEAGNSKRETRTLIDVRCAV